MGLREKIHAYRPERPPRVSDSPEVKRVLEEKIKLWAEWKANGKYTAKNPDGSWQYTIDDLTAEARARTAEGGR